MFKRLTTWSCLATILLIQGCQTNASTDSQLASPIKANLPALKKVTKQPNILWIITDDQRADSIAAFNRDQRGENASALGYVESPNIDKLAQEGVMFTHAYNNSPACAPSRSSMIMGLYPHHSGRFGFERTHDQHDLMTKPIPVALRDKGYQTALFGKQGVRIYEYKNGNTWNSLGFYDTVVDMKNDLAHNNLTDFVKIDHFDKEWKHIGKTERFIFPEERVVNLPVNKGFDSSTSAIDKELDILRSYTRSQETLIIGGVSSKPAGETLDGYILKSFQQYLSNQNQSYQTDYNKKLSGPNTSKPLMVNLGFHFPHTPVLPPKSFRDKFKNKHYDVPDFSRDELKKLPPQLRTVFNRLKTDELTPEEKQQAIADYYAFCAYGDYLIGQAVESFKEYNKKLDQEYLILLTVGDHGWQLGEQGIEAKFSPWNTSNQGIIIAVDSTKKRFPQGHVFNQFTEYVDIAPTLLGAAGIDLAAEGKHLDGFDLAQIIRDKELKRDYVIGELNVFNTPRAYLRAERFAFSMRVRKENGFPGHGYEPGENIKWVYSASAEQVEMALYDLHCDTNEQNNVAYDKAYEKVAIALRKKLTDIIVGDGRVEVNWLKPNRYYVSDFSIGAHDRKLNGVENLFPKECH
ncbi:sulfatase-like hydrolase/transferase [Colwellia sp. RE-S-Sl-9]